jgi:hypothetical protein
MHTHTCTNTHTHTYTYNAMRDRIFTIRLQVDALTRALKLLTQTGQSFSSSSACIDSSSHGSIPARCDSSNNAQNLPPNLPLNRTTPGQADVPEPKAADTGSVSPARSSPTPNDHNDQTDRHVSPKGMPSDSSLQSRAQQTAERAVCSHVRLRPQRPPTAVPCQHRWHDTSEPCSGVAFDQSVTSTRCFSSKNARKSVPSHRMLSQADQLTTSSVWTQNGSSLASTQHG